MSSDLPVRVFCLALADHGWYLAKLDIINVRVMDYFGGAATVNVGDYFAAHPY